MKYKKSLIILFVLLFILFFWGMGNYQAQFIPRYQSTGLNSHFISKPSFTHYVQYTSSMIAKARQKNKVNSTSETIAENSPQEILPDPIQCKMIDNKYEKGIVLVHGLLDSPYPMQWLAQYFQQKCFVVYIVLLPGHGTSPGDLLNVNYQDWIEVTHFAVAQLKQKVNQVYLLGFSLGGLLVIHEALQDATIKALILFAPCLGFTTKLTPLIKPIYWLGRLFPRLKWWAYHDDAINVRYESYPVNPVYQTLLLLQKVKFELTHKKLFLPVFIEQGFPDETVDAQATLEFFAKDQNPNSRLLWYAQNANPPVNFARLQILDSTLLYLKVLGLSHVSPFLPETDKIYGKEGSYHDCLHYPEKSSKWLQCKNGKDNYLGEVTHANLRKYLMQRLTFNPFVPYLFEQMDLFLKNN